jgi:hypothetical protein
VSRRRTIVAHSLASIAVLLAGTLAYAWWIRRLVDEEYRIGARSADDPDAIMIPIAGFAITLAGVLLVVNVLVVLARWWWRRRPRARDLRAAGSSRR